MTKTTEQEPLQRIKEFTPEGITEPAYLFHLLIGAYISGYATIIIRSKDRFPRSSVGGVVIYRCIEFLYQETCARSHLFKGSFDLDPFSGDHVVDILRHLAGMIS